MRTRVALIGAGAWATQAYSACIKSAGEPPTVRIALAVEESARARAPVTMQPEP